MIDCALLKNTFLFRFELRSFGNSRRAMLPDSAIIEAIGGRPPSMTDEEWASKLTAARRRIKGSKRLIESAEYNAILRFQDATKQRLLKLFCNPSFLDEGVFSVKQELVPEVENEISLAKAEMARLVSRFLTVYGEAKAEAEKVLADQFDRRDYPPEETVRSRFGISHRWIAFKVPEGLPPEIREAEEKKLRESFERAEAAITGALWAEFASFVQAVEGKLGTGENGKPKVFRDTLFEELATFVRAFNNRNTFNDERLEGLVKQAEAIVAKVGGKDNADKAQRMRDFEQLRAQTKSAFEGLKAEVEKGIQEKPERAFRFEEDAA